MDTNLDDIKNRIAELENLTARTHEQNHELAVHYTAWATYLYDSEEGDWESIALFFGKAETLLITLLEQEDDDEIRQHLSNVYLEWGGALYGFGDTESAVGIYQKAVDVLRPLDEAGNGEAKYDMAGLKLNLGIGYRELGELQKAKTYLDESFLDYRAVEKISDDDTRVYMATVSVQQGNLLHELGEPLEAVVDAYNRAMRLYVEVIEDQGQIVLERELANVLIDRSLVTYEHWLGKKFESEEEQKSIIDNVLLDISRGIELLEKQYREGNEPARHCLFHAVALQGKVMCDVENFADAKLVLDRAEHDFADLCEEDDAFMMQLAMVYATRAIALMGLGDKESGERDCLKGSELVNRLLQSNDSDAEIQELRQQFQTLLKQL